MAGATLEEHFNEEEWKKLVERRRFERKVKKRPWLLNDETETPQDQEQGSSKDRELESVSDSSSLSSWSSELFDVEPPAEDAHSTR